MEVIGGYRLVRKLGSGGRADVFLGHAGSPASPSGPRTAAIKVFRSSASRASIDVEIEAIARASSPHLVRLDDLATAPDGRPVLILGLLGPVTLAKLLEHRGEIGASEAVTMLAPVASAVCELHRVGVAHRQLRLTSVLFDGSGAPVVASFGRATLLGSMPEIQGSSSLTPVALAERSDALQDLSALTALARTVIESTPGTPARSNLLDWLRDADTVSRPDLFPGELSERLFDFAPASPILFENSDYRRSAVPPAVSIAAPEAPRGRRETIAAEAEAEARAKAGAGLRAGARSGLRARAGAGSRARERRPSAAGRPAARATVLRFSEGLHAAAVRMQGFRVLGAVASALRGLTALRRPVWFAGGAALVLVTTALWFLPPSSGSAASRPPPPAVSAPAGTSMEKTADGDAVEGDDPAVATKALIALRWQCLRDHSVLCLRGVDQAGSAVEEADGYLVRQLQDGEAIDPAMSFDGASVAVIDRMGNSAIVTLTTDGDPDSAPASILLVKSEAGWRIRDLLVG